MGGNGRILFRDEEEEAELKENEEERGDLGVAGLDLGDKRRGSTGISGTGAAIAERTTRVEQSSTVSLLLGLMPRSWPFAACARQFNRNCTKKHRLYRYSFLTDDFDHISSQGPKPWESRHPCNRHSFLLDPSKARSPRISGLRWPWTEDRKNAYHQPLRFHRVSLKSTFNRSTRVYANRAHSHPLLASLLFSHAVFPPIQTLLRDLQAICIGRKKRGFIVQQAAAGDLAQSVI